MKAETVETVERERERATLYSTWNSFTRPYVLVNKTGLVFMPKNSKNYVNRERVY